MNAYSQEPGIVSSSFCKMHSTSQTLSYLKVLLMLSRGSFRIQFKLYKTKTNQNKRAVDICSQAQGDLRSFLTWGDPAFPQKKWKRRWKKQQHWLFGSSEQLSWKYEYETLSMNRKKTGCLPETSVPKTELNRGGWIQSWYSHNLPTLLCEK